MRLILLIGSILTVSLVAKSEDGFLKNYNSSIGAGYEWNTVVSMPSVLIGMSKVSKNFYFPSWRLVHAQIGYNEKIVMGLRYQHGFSLLSSNIHYYKIPDPIHWRMFIAPSFQKEVGGAGTIGLEYGVSWMKVPVFLPSLALKYIYSSDIGLMIGLVINATFGKARSRCNCPD